MYNRYVPQPDGSYRRNRVPDQSPPVERPRPPIPQQPPKEEPCQPPKEPAEVKPPQPRSAKKHREHSDSSVTGFLRQLLPKDFDTGDLLIVLLLLLMAGSCEEDQNSALLTLALYLFM